MLVVVAAGSIWHALIPQPLTIDGRLDSRVCLLFSLAVAALVLLSSLRRSVGAGAAWLALGIAGQAATLQLVQAGPQVGYQHLRVLSIDRGDALYLLVLGAQALAVAVALARRRADLRRLVDRLGRGRTAVLVAATFALSAFPASNVVGFGLELAVAGTIQLLQVATFGLAAASLPRSVVTRLAARLSGTSGDRPLRRERVVLLAAAAVVGIAALLAVVVYERHPHIPDEVAYLFQARYLAEGRLTVPGPEVPAAFDAYLIACDEETCHSPFPPGWPLALAAGVKLGQPYLVNPVLAGLVVLLAWTLARELYDRRIALLTALLAAVSPWNVFMGMSLLSHSFSTCCALIALLGAFRLRRTGLLRHTLPAGLGAGLVFLTRPLDGVVLVLAVAAIALRIRGRWLAPKPVAALALVGAASCGATLAYNHAITGEATAFPVAEYMDDEFGSGRNALGFGPDRDLGWRGVDPLPGHGVADVLINADLNTVAINVELLGWATGSLLPVLLLLACGRLRAADGWMLLLPALTAGLHSFYWFSGGPDFGARYWYLALFPCLVLTARGLEALGGVLSGGGSRGADETGLARAVVFAAETCGLTCGTCWTSATSASRCSWFGVAGIPTMQRRRSTTRWTSVPPPRSWPGIAAPRCGSDSSTPTTIDRSG
jgi:hypothetical protein